MASTTTTTRRVPPPDVFPSYAVRKVLAQIFSPSFLQVLPHLLPRVPRWLKMTLYALVVVNIHSFPLLWHIRVFGTAFLNRMRARPGVHPLLPFIRSNKHATTMPGVSPQLRLDCLPLGKDIFSHKARAVFRATPDLCDYNMHLSNSSYPKVVDYVRLQYFSTRFMRCHYDGGDWALGATSFVFHREVPMMQRFEVEIQLAAWDEKWFYIIARFMSPSPGAHLSTTKQLSRSKSAQNLKRLMADVVKPHHEAAKEAPKPIKPAQDDDEAVPDRHRQSKQTLYCTGISRGCIKAGRKTIPPWFVIATSGYGTFASTRTNWDRAEHLRRETLQRAKQEYEEQSGGRALPRDSLFLGNGHRRGGILTAYDPSRKEGEQDAYKSNLGLGAWQDRKTWHTAEWEERRVKGLRLVQRLGGVASPDLAQVSQELRHLDYDD